MAQAKFRAIIFDIGRVLIRVDVSRAMDGLASGLSLTPKDGPRSKRIPIGSTGRRGAFLRATGIFI